ncbi:MAG: isocitrate lyase/phosphoenolpyruvate mutase family protein [Proteobacteria bacterium]|nr:isocitrate lyase/phosphoenolpyruvate mutase family protein [Pseudomonadota bacterium]
MNAVTTTQAEKAQRFAALHARAGCFVIPNPWDAGSAKILERLGFEALATTSAGYAFSLGLLDGAVGLDAMIDHCRMLCAATSLPVSADLENGYAHDPKAAAQTLVRGAEAGLVGGSIEDYTNDEAKPIYAFNHAVERVQASVEAVKKLPFKFTFCARAENLIHGINDLDDTIRRLQAFEKAGADVLYAPGLKTLDEVRMVTQAVGKPVNINMSGVPHATVAQIAEAGGKRISTGGALARAAIGALVRAGREMQTQGSFGWAAGATPGAEIKTLVG